MKPTHRMPTSERRQIEIAALEALTPVDGRPGRGWAVNRPPVCRFGRDRGIESAAIPGGQRASGNVGKSDVLYQPT